jgi:hypothetical protein
VEHPPQFSSHRSMFSHRQDVDNVVMYVDIPLAPLKERNLDLTEAAALAKQLRSRSNSVSLLLTSDLTCCGNGTEKAMAKL